jgi:hypothetical protein
MLPDTNLAMSVADTSILWRRLDQPGHEAARLILREPEWHLHGSAVFQSDGLPCRLDYRVACDSKWETCSGHVTGWLGTTPIKVDVEVQAGGWRLNGVDSPAVAGCIDLDLNFSPSTNLLPVRRLNLAVGAVVLVRAAWLKFPSFELEPLEQVYRRTGDSTYRYESAGGKFVADLSVNSAGFVTDYPGFWRVE